MISFEGFQLFVWTFVIIGWLGTIIISFASIGEIIKMFKGVK